MKRSFYLVAVLCLLGNVAYATDDTINITGLVGEMNVADVLNHNAITESVKTEWKKMFADKIKNKTLRVIRTIEVIKEEQSVLFGKSDLKSPNKLKELEDEENEYNRKVTSFAGFQRAVVYVYRHRLSVNAIGKILDAFVEELYDNNIINNK
jgi:hypothetical protein